MYIGERHSDEGISSDLSFPLWNNSPQNKEKIFLAFFKFPIEKKKGIFRENWKKNFPLRQNKGVFLRRDKSEDIIP